MKRRLKIVASTLLMSLIGGIYWFCWFLMAEGLLAADYGPDAIKPSEAWLATKVGPVLLGGFAVFAALLALWRRFDRWILP